jgi:hypothetical protein
MDRSAAGDACIRLFHLSYNSCGDGRYPEELVRIRLIVVFLVYDFISEQCNMLWRE